MLFSFPNQNKLVMKKLLHLVSLLANFIKVKSLNFVKFIL
ncbi:hypothetical protein 04086_4606 [Escherichia phage 04086]|nr:hypothetical protein 04086_4606 [Escherichia phage 04086]